MEYGEGAGALLWRAFFGDALDLTVLEFDAACLHSWAARPANLDTVVFSGDQTDPALLKNIIDLRGPFDVVVDDGGHCMKCQIAAIENFFPNGLVPGGVLFIEDLFTAQWTGWGADGPPFSNGVLADVADALVVRGNLYRDVDRAAVSNRRGARPRVAPLAAHMERMECTPEICAFVRSKST